MELFKTLEEKHGLPAGLLDAVWATESSRGKNLNNSSAGARGHFQFMPATAKQYGIYGQENDLTASATAAARMYSDLMRQSGGNLDKALAGYNWGSGNVQRKGMQNMPTETRNYIQKVRATMGAQEAPQRRGMPIIGMRGQPAPPRMTRTSNDDPFAALRSKYGAPAEQHAAPRQNDPFAALREKYDTPAPQPTTSQSGKVPQQSASNAQPVDKYQMRRESVERGVQDLFQGGAQLLTNMLPDSVVRAGDNFNNWLADKTGLVPRLPEGGVNQQTKDLEARHQAMRQANGETGFDWYRLFGNVINPANIALGGAGSAPTMGANIARSAATGAVSAGLNPVTEGDFWSEKAKQVATGAAFGAAVPAITHGIGRVISPNASRNPRLQMLRKEGVKPTVGQTLGGAWNKAEEKATSIPFAGDFIAGRRKDALEQFNNAAINRAGNPIGKRVQGAGSSAVAEMGDMASSAQERAKNMIGAFQIDAPAAASLSKIESMAGGIPDKQARSSVIKAINLIKTQASQRGFMTPESYKEVASAIGQDAAYLSGSSNGYQRKAGDALKEIVKTLEDAGYRQNPSASAAMKKANQSWANLVRVEGASKAAANNGGVFTPAQLMSAVRQADKSVRGRSVARGTALMQDFAEAGQSVLGNKVPNSGTPDRLLNLGAIVAGPAVLPGLGAAGVLYTPRVQDLLTASIASRPQYAQAVREALHKTSPMFTPLGAQIGAGLLK